VARDGSGFMDLTNRAAHFEFGENWKDYAKSIDQRRIDAAIEGVRKLFPGGLAGKTFLDIGSGSGLHSVAAISLGAISVVAVDIDENSVNTTRELLTKYAPKFDWKAGVASIFEMTPDNFGSFDVVYSWGVLHHTGDMWRAIRLASNLVKPGGHFAIAIYSATRSEAAWKVAKRIYSRLPRMFQWAVRQVYMAAYLGRMSLTANPVSYVRNYSAMRGMNFSHDAHDWLGGYPYEAARADELHDRISALGFSEVRSFRLPVTVGLFGSGCHEFVFQKL
jgi:2-polyprenyl-3-methyl-5-hydroxy-6-metoxy-1,4-benzoquinol methylase